MKGGFRSAAILVLAGISGGFGFAVGRGGKNTGGETAPEVEVKFRMEEREGRLMAHPMEDFGRLLAGEMESGAIWRVVSRLSEKEVLEALSELRRARDKGGSGLERVEQALYFRWAENDPQAALDDLLEMPVSMDWQHRREQDDRLKSVLAAWMRKDPDAAYAAVKDHKSYSFIGRNMLVKTWTAENVFANAAKFPDKHRELLGGYASRTANDEERRNALLKVLEEQPDLRDGDSARFLLFRSWGYGDFLAAIAEAEKRNLPEMEKLVLEDSITIAPWHAMPLAAERGISPGGNDWMEGYMRWLGAKPEEARQWLTEQAPGWRESGHGDAVVRMLSVDYLIDHGIPGEKPKEDRAAAFLEEMDLWRRDDPEGAGNWLDRAPGAVRKLVGENGGVER